MPHCAPIPAEYQLIPHGRRTVLMAPQARRGGVVMRVTLAI